MKLRYLLFGTLLLTQFAAAEACIIRALVYSSFIGKGSIGEWIQEEWSKNANECSVEFVSTKEFSGLWGDLKKNSKNKEESKIDVVLGLSDAQLNEAKKNKWIDAHELFDFSPYAIVVDSNKIKNFDKIKSWEDLSLNFKKQILIQDPRMSNTGLGWLRSIYEFELIRPEVSSNLVKKVFPSWSSSYEAFLSGLGSAVWTYRTSAAYHRCEEKKENYKVLELKEGYPVQNEWVALVSNSRLQKNANNFINFLSSKSVQEKIPLLNWMYPANKSVVLPKCFLENNSILNKASGNVPALKVVEDWMERWSLL